MLQRMKSNFGRNDHYYILVIGFRVEMGGTETVTLSKKNAINEKTQRKNHLEISTLAAQLRASFFIFNLTRNLTVIAGTNRFIRNTIRRRRDSGEINYFVSFFLPSRTQFYS